MDQNNLSNKFDEELESAVKKYQVRNGFNPVASIEPKHIIQINLPISERIGQIVVNMERCRWISPEIAKSKELVVVNIPSFKLIFFKDGKSVLESAVVIGKNLNKTVIFSGKMSYIVFSPYWTPAKIDAAMNADKESTCVLKNEIPIYIGYFTAWVNEKGEISFYEDVYKRDENLFKLQTDNP